MSENFILRQAEALREFRPVYVGQRAIAGLQLPSKRCVLLVNGRPLQRLGQFLYERFGPSDVQVKRLRVIAPALIHAHFGPDATHAMPLARALRIPLVVTHHGYDVTVRNRALSSASLRRYVSSRTRLYDMASLVLCASRFVREKALEKGATPEKTLVHYIGIDLDHFHPDRSLPRSDIVLFVGRLVENKGCALLLNAMRVVQREFSQCRVMIIGDGPLRRQLERAARELNLRHVTLAGTLAPVVVRHWMNRARVLSVPSITTESGASEGLGMVFLEAQAMGLPVASFATGGISEAVADGIGGLLAREGDVAQLARNISALLRSESLWERFSQAGQRYVRERFDLRRQTAILEGHYRAVLRHDKHTVPA